MNKEEIKKIAEVLIFVSDKPVTQQTLVSVLEENPGLLKEVIAELREEYESMDKGFKLIEIADGWQFVTDPKYGPWLKKLYKKQVNKLSMPALETLAIIAYKQPVTKHDVERIRGVNVDGVLKNLLEKGLLKICGRKETVGRPFTYGTTKEFLEYFGLGKIEDLPMRQELQKEIIMPPAPQEQTAESAMTEESAQAPDAREDKEKVEIKNGETPDKQEPLS
jgi:segregation and condensation protein B